MGGCYRLVPGGIVVSIRMTPKSSRDEVEGVTVLSDGRSVMKVRVRAVPDKGAANQALLALLAKALGVPKSSVEIVSGATARLKEVRISGEAAALAAAVDRTASRQD
jgi:uncharacterized protein (TIGR00251 family)